MPLYTAMYLITVMLCTCCAVSGRAPHVIVFIADDLGWDDVGFHGSGQVLTPTIDALASEAVVLDNYYSSPICSPSRGALLTGVHPIHASMQNYVIGTAEPRGLPLCLRLLPQYLNPLGYKSHLIGKWHLGFYRRPYTPTHRGFDSHFGYWTGEIGYYDHTAMEDSDSWGVDFRDDMDLAVNHSGKYTTELFTERGVNRIRDHDDQVPLFLMIAYQNVHTGNRYSRLEAPERLRHHFTHIQDENRKTFAAMLLAMDQSIATIMHALKSKDMLENSIVIFASDNGAAVAGLDGNYGSNWPLRGTKYSLWEGGIRVPAFIWSPLIAHKPYVSHELFHVTDWVPTILAAVQSPDAKIPLVYGVSQWESLSHRTATPRKELLHNIDPIWNVSSIRVSRFKLVQGLVLRPWQGWFPPPRGQHHAATFVSTRIHCNHSQSSDCAPDSAPCLFDIEKDPCEMENIADQETQVVKDLWQRVQDHAQTASPAGREERDAGSWPPLHGYAWSCWRGDEQAGRGECSHLHVGRSGE